MKSVILATIVVSVLSSSCGGNNADSDTPKKEDSSVPSAVEPAADTVNMPRLITQTTDEPIRLTAETGKAQGPEIKYMPEWRAFGWFTGADSVTWDVEVKTPGTYDAYLEWSVSDEEAGKEFILSAKGSQLTGTVDKSGSWETFKTKNIGRVQLDAGRQIISFRSKTKFNDGALLDLREIKLVKY